jgi:hypothetical protein
MGRANNYASVKKREKEHLKTLGENRCKIFPVLPRTSANIPPWGMGAC